MSDLSKRLREEKQHQVLETIDLLEEAAAAVDRLFDVDWAASIVTREARRMHESINGPGTYFGLSLEEKAALYMEVMTGIKIILKRIA